MTIHISRYWGICTAKPAPRALKPRVFTPHVIKNYKGLGQPYEDPILPISDKPKQKPENDREQEGIK